MMRNASHIKCVGAVHIAIFIGVGAMQYSHPRDSVNDIHGGMIPIYNVTPSLIHSNIIYTGEGESYL